MDPDLIVVGDMMVDVSVDSASLRGGGDVHGEVLLRPGGSAANAAVWAASAGARVRLHGRVGDDLAGRMIREAVTKRGVEAAVAVDPEGRTGTMLVVREAGERSMVADRGANEALSPTTCRRVSLPRPSWCPVTSPYIMGPNPLPGRPWTGPRPAGWPSTPRRGRS
jgi:sugar/nucleoside kinase (ribokinase family)